MITIRIYRDLDLTECFLYITCKKKKKPWTHTDAHTVRELTPFYGAETEALMQKHVVEPETRPLSLLISFFFYGLRVV